MTALSYCLRLLKRRFYSVWEVDQAMLRRAVPAEEREEVIKRLLEARLLDDRQFAKAWLSNRDRFNPRSHVVLRMELRQKGIAQEAIDEALAERSERLQDTTQVGPPELQLAQELIRRKERLYASLTPEVRRRRQLALLQRRGFPYEVIRRILDS